MSRGSVGSCIRCGTFVSLSWVCCLRLARQSSGVGSRKGSLSFQTVVSSKQMASIVLHNQNYPVGGKTRLATRHGLARLGRAGQGRAGQDRVTSMTNWHKTANTRRL